MKGYRLILTYLLVWLLLFIALVFGGCTATRYIPVETVRRDTVYQSKTGRDSVYLHDSVFVKVWQKGDTVYNERDRWHVKYVVKEVHDTLYSFKVDSIAVPYPVEKDLSWWSRVKIDFGGLAMIVMAGLLLFVVVRLCLR